MSHHMAIDQVTIKKFDYYRIYYRILLRSVYAYRSLGARAVENGEPGKRADQARVVCRGVRGAGRLPANPQLPRPAYDR